MAETEHKLVLHLSIIAGSRGEAVEGVGAFLEACEVEAERYDVTVGEFEHEPDFGQALTTAAGIIDPFAKVESITGLMNLGRVLHENPALAELDDEETIFAAAGEDA